MRKPKTKQQEDELLKLAFSIMGSRKTERKADAARKNGRLSKGRPLKPLEDFPCTCEGRTEHKKSCLRGKAQRRRNLPSTVNL
jgi:hypothetical protein